MADFVDLRHIKQYMPRLPTRDCDFKTLYRFEEQHVQWVTDRFLTEKENLQRIGYLC